MTDNMSTLTIASYQTYAEAQYAVDGLSDRHFPVERLAIVGAGLESYEKITGRKRYGRAAVEGLVSGAAVGALLGWLFGLFSLAVPLVGALLLTLWGLVIGAIIGAILGMFGHALTGGRRDFSSVSAVRAQRYNVTADAEAAVEAERVLAEFPPMPPTAAHR